MGMIQHIALSRIVDQGNIVGRNGYFSPQYLQIQ